MFPLLIMKIIILTTFGRLTIINLLGHDLFFYLVMFSERYVAIETHRNATRTIFSGSSDQFQVFPLSKLFLLWLLGYG